MSVTDSPPNAENAKTPPPPPAPVSKQTSWIDNWFDHLPFGDRWPSSLLTRVGEFEPVRVEQFRDGDDLVIRAEMPGIENEDDIDVTLAGDKLTVSAKREHRSEVEDEGTFRSEFRYGSFSRTVTVPPGTDPDGISASYVNGIVDVRVKVDGDAADTRSIKVDRG